MGLSTGAGPFYRRRDLLFLLTVYVSLSFVTNFPSGFTNSSVNTAVEALDSFIARSYRHRGYSLNEGTLSLVRSATLNAWFFFQIFGALISPMFLDEYGRRQGYIIGCAVTLASTVVQLAGVRLGLPELVVIGRSLTAVASPLCDACLILYLQETAPLSIRGEVSFFCEIGHGAMCVLGSVLGMSNVLGYALSPLLLSSIPPEVFSLFIVWLVPETPKYLLIMRNDRAGAIRSLDFFLGAGLKGNEGHDEILWQIERERAVEAGKRQSSFRECLSTFHIRRAILLSCAVLVLTLSFYPLLQSSTYFFLALKLSSSVSQYSSMLLMVIFTLSCVVGSTIIDRFPRRKLIIGFGIITNTFLLAFAVLSHCTHAHPALKYAALAAVLGYCISFGLVLGPLSWFVATEMVSQRHRATVFSICYAVSNALIAATNFATVPLYRLIGGASFVVLFILPSLFSLIFIYRCMPESLGKQAHEVVTEIRKSQESLYEADHEPLLPDAADDCWIDDDDAFKY
ncbi:hypothetical protein PMAYCL1PPCAC_09703 [Pristionchus mayeri]|uniref:Major facilitator superfamily (MFS) profile domain-containing protein n=1 Tax=Pristionchus mayeri TaxID=1317129 RepID=A0AAN4ZJY6_9BILA|nr:hypothetical protein PMAYCL1PPCAC_09703 [Pristionchus mayeri]